MPFCPPFVLTHKRDHTCGGSLVHVSFVPQANIDQIVNAVKFKDDVVAGEELLSAFQLVDKHG